MVQENSTFVVSSMINKKMNSSCCCITHECLPWSIEEINAISLEEEELKRQKRGELIDYYIKRHEEKEAELKRKNEVCVDAIEDLYYLTPTGKRSKRKRKSKYRVCTSTFLKKENKKLKILLKENEPIQDFEVPGIINVESLLKNVHGDLMKIQELEKERTPKIESFLKRGNNKLKIVRKGKEPIQDFEVPGIIKVESLLKNVHGDWMKIQELEKERTPKIKSFMKSEKIKKMVQNKRPNRVSQAVLPEEFKNKIQELGVPISEVSLVIEKKLFSTDLSDKHMRLSIPVKQVLNIDEFLTPQEKEILDTRDSCNRWSQIKFNLIEPSLEVCNIHLAKWPMNSSCSYVLLNDWMSVCLRNDLMVDMMVQLWYFRKDSNRWLALVVVPPDQAAAVNCSMY